jgi:hypothetical protein
MLTLESQDYMTPEQVAEIAHVVPDTLSRWRSSGKGPPFIRLGGRSVLYYRPDVISWLEAHRKGTNVDREARREVVLPIQPERSRIPEQYRIGRNRGQQKRS